MTHASTPHRFFRHDAESLAGLYSKLRISRFHIVANDKCVGCTECTHNCQIGIDVMSFAIKQEVLDNSNSSCIGCGICVSVYPMDVLSFKPSSPRQGLVQIETKKAA